MCVQQPLEPGTRHAEHPVLSNSGDAILRDNEQDRRYHRCHLPDSAHTRNLYLPCGRFPAFRVASAAMAFFNHRNVLFRIAVDHLRSEVPSSYRHGV